MENKIKEEAEKYFKEYSKNKGKGAITLNVIDFAIRFYNQQSQQPAQDEELKYSNFDNVIGMIEAEIDSLKFEYKRAEEPYKSICSTAILQFLKAKKKLISATPQTDLQSKVNEALKELDSELLQKKHIPFSESVARVWHREGFIKGLEKAISILNSLNQQK